MGSKSYNKLRSEEREGAGKAGGNPNLPAGAFGGAVAPNFANEFATPFGMTLLGLTQGDRLFGGGGGAGGTEGGAAANDELLRGLMDLWRGRLDVERNRPREVFQAEQQALDPVGWAQRMYQARLAGDPWAAGGTFNAPSSFGFSPTQVAATRDLRSVTPEERLASRGLGAADAWRKIFAMRGTT